MKTGPLSRPHPEWDIEIKIQGPPGNLGVIANEIAAVVDQHKGTLTFSEVLVVPVPRKGERDVEGWKDPCEVDRHDWYYAVDGERSCRRCHKSEQVL